MRADGPPGGRPPFVLAIAALVAIGVAGATHGLVRWLALAVVLALVPALVGLARSSLSVPGSLGARVRPWLPQIVLVAFAGAMLWELVLGHPPATRDHGIHYFQAKILVDDMLPRFSGWNDRINHGYPYGEGYPTLGYLWVSAFHLVSGGLVDLRTSYAWGLLGVWALISWGVWHVAALVYDDVAARIGGELAPREGPEPDPRWRSWAGCLGAIAWLLDPGESRQGGWEYLMFHGVWPQALSAALWVASLVLVRRALVRPSPRAIGLAALAIAGGLLAHPFGLLTTAGSMVGWIAVLAIADDARGLPIGRTRVLAIVHVLGLALAAGGIATFLAASGEMGRSPATWALLGDLAGRFALGELFVGPWGWTGVLAVVGFALALFAARSFAWLVAGLVAGMLLLASHESVTVLQLDLVTSAFKNLQFSRWAIAIKPLAFALVGPAAIVAAVALARLVRTDASRPASPWARRAFVAVLLAPLVATAISRSDVLVPRPIGAIDTLENGNHLEAERTLRAALVEERAHTPHMRVAFLRSRMGGAMYALFAIADADAAVVLDGHVPTVNFVHVVDQRYPVVLRRLGVTHVVHDRPLVDEDELVAALEPLGTHGPYTLARFLPEPRPFAELLDPGTVEVLDRTDERVELDVAPTGPTRLTLAWAPSERWTWTVNGEPRETVPTSVRGGVELLGVDVDGPARVVLEYVRSDRERFTAWASWIAMVIAALALLRGRPFELRDLPRGATTMRAARWLGVLALVMAAGFVVRRQREQLAETWTDYADAITLDATRDPMPPFAGDLTVERGITVTRTPERICVGLLGKDPLVDCRESDAGPLVGLVYVEPFLYRCTSFTVAPGGEADVTLGEDAQEVLAVLVRRGGDKSRDLRYEVTSGDHPSTSRALVTRAELRIRPSADGEPARLHFTNASDEPERICLAAARFGP